LIRSEFQLGPLRGSIIPRTNKGQTGSLAECGIRDVLASQVPWGVEALAGAIGEPAWRTKPSWYLVVTDDKMIPPDAQRAMSKRAGSQVVEVKGSHAVYVSHPEPIAALIEQAAKSVKTSAAA